MRAKTVVAVLVLAACSILLNAPAFATTPTTWGSVKARYRGAGESAAVTDPGLSPNTQQLPCDDCEGGGGDYTYWYGNLVALPHGSPMEAPFILSKAYQMPAVQLAISTFQNRGYIRRTDLDEAVCKSVGTYAMIAFEKPGHSTWEQQPFILIETVTWGDYWVTQLIGGIAQDSSGICVLREPAGDESLVVQGAPTGHVVFEGMGDVYVAMYTGRTGGPPNTDAAWNYWTGHDAEYWTKLGVNIGATAIVAGATGGGGVVARCVAAAGWGALAGGLYVYNNH